MVNRKVLYPRVVLVLLLAAGIVLSGVWQMAERQWVLKPGMNGGGTGAAITAGIRIDAGRSDCLREEKTAGCISGDGKRKGGRLFWSEREWQNLKNIII